MSNNFDWHNPRVQVRAEDDSDPVAWLDLSNRIIDFSVTLVDSYAADTWKVTFSNTDQYVTDNISYGGALEISATFNQVDQEVLIQGRLEDPEPAFTKSSGSTVSMTGKDWTAELQNVLVMELYKNGTFTASTDPYIGQIVRDLIVKYAPVIDASGVPNTTTQIDYKLFSRIPLFDCIKFLADLIDYRFYVDSDKNLIFEPIPTPVLVSDTFTGTGDPAGWTEQSGTWAISGNSYEQSNNSGKFTSYRTSENFEDIIIDAYVTISEGTMAGFAFRLNSSTGDHYFVALDVPANRVRLYTVDNWTGTETELTNDAFNGTLAYSTAYRVRIFCKTVGTSGALFTIFVGDMVNCALTWEDAVAYVASGKVGCRTENAVALFDNFTAANAYLVIEEGFNTTSLKIKTQLSRLKNRIFVQGGYEKFPTMEVFTPSGSTDTITLTYLPSEVEVYVTGDTSPKKGGIYGIDDNDVSVYFLVDYFSKHLIRRGANWSAVVTTIYYNRNVPVMGTAQDLSSIAEAGIRDFLHVDKLLNTQDLVDQKAEAILAKLQNIAKVGSATVVGAIWGMTPGDYVLVRSPMNGVPDYIMMQANSITIKYNKSNGLTYDFVLDNENVSLALLLNSYEARLKKLERRDTTEALIKYLYPDDDAHMADSTAGYSNDMSGAFKIGHYARLGHNRRLGNASGGWVNIF